MSITPQTVQELCSSAQIARLAACLDLPMPAMLPPLWHWVFFNEAAASSDLGPDGHRARGGLVALDAGLPRRMWAGGRVRFARPVALAQPLWRNTSVAQEQVREGRSGRLRFVTLRHVISDAAGVVIEEEQDLVYRAPAQPGQVAAPAAAAAPAPAGAMVAEMRPNPVLLFRFSALTFNAHRIHYDLPYARDEEGYAGLVVHGPLQAIWLAAHAARLAPGRGLASFAYRGQSPAFADQDLRLEAWAEGPGIMAQSRAPGGAICMSAQAEFYDE